MSRKMPGLLTIAAVGLGVLLLAGLIVLAATVDDWSRDLSTNHAATDPAADDPRLRPIDTPLAPPAAAARVTQAADGLAHWSDPQTNTPGEVQELHFVRTTPLFRFKDDITVRIVSTPAGSQITAESQSRVGRGDLGQNPRNLQELMAAIREELDSP